MNAMNRGRNTCALALFAAMACGWSGALIAGDITSGRKLYATHCASCHGAGGISVMPGAPNFRRGERLMQPDALLRAHIQTGKNACPAHRGILSEREIMDLIAHLRTMN